MTEEELEILIDKYYNGDTTLDEEKRLSDHYDQFVAQETGDANYALFAFFKSRQIDQPGPAFVSRIEAITSGQVPVKQRNLAWIARVAAALTVVAAVVWWLLPLDMSPNELATGTGERRSIDLPDGTVVWLNSNTNVEYDDGFETGARNMRLSGEAYFEVKPDHERPFRIHTGKVAVEVLGTSFNLRSYPSETDIVLNVTTGLVKFGSKEKVEVAGGNRATYNIPANAIRSLTPANPNATAWKTRRLVFEDALLGDVADDLARYFDKSVVIETPEALNCHFTGSFEKPELAEVLKVIGYTLNMEYDIREGGVVLSGQNCSTK